MAELNEKKINDAEVTVAADADNYDDETIEREYLEKKKAAIEEDLKKPPSFFCTVFHSTDYR